MRINPYTVGKEFNRVSDKLHIEQGNFALF